VIFPVSKIFEILDGLLMSGLVIVEVMVILVYENLCGGNCATLCLLVLSCVDKLKFGLRERFEVVFLLFFDICVYGYIYGLNLGLTGST